MNAVESIRHLLAVVAQHTLLERLFVAGLELVFVTAVVLAIINIARLKSSRVIALLWLVALAKPVVSLVAGAPATVWNAGSLGVTSEVATRTAANTEHDKWAGTPPGSGERQLAAPVEPATAATVRPFADPAKTAATAWLIGVGLMALLSTIDRLRIRKLIASASAPPPEIMNMYVEAGEGAARLPRLLVSDRLESPAITGTLFPVVFLPGWMTRTPDRQHIVWSLRHELTHWRHRDHLAGVVCELSRILFFFHPLVWWIDRQRKIATEIACDQSLVATNRDARRYAEQLYQILARVHTRRQIMLANGLFATRTQIGKRIELLLKSRPRRSAGGHLSAALFVLSFAAVVLCVGAELTPQAAPGKSTSTEITVKDDNGRHTSLKIEGNVIFSKDRNDVHSISEGGFFEISEERDGVERFLRITPSDRGELEYDYEVDGKERSFDDQAREWLSEILEYTNADGGRDVFLVSGTGTGSRKAVIIDKPGSSDVEVRVEDPVKTIDVYRDDDEASVKVVVRDDVDAPGVSIETTTDVMRNKAGRAVIRVMPGLVRITVEKDGSEHELEVRTGDRDEKEYIYKLDGRIRPYDEKAKKIFEDYIDILDGGLELRTRGERI